MASLIGRTVGNYRIEALLGSGGMGQVFRGVHVHLRRPAAIKVMRAELAADQRFQRYFRREGILAANLDHPNIVQIYEFGEFSHDDERGAYLAMELIGGGSLRSLLEAQDGAPLPLRQGLELIRQAAEALAYAHRHGVIHRDIKPDNLLLEVERDELKAAGSYVVKVSDFGLARPAEESGIAHSGAILGTPAYMSPEQCRGQKDIDHRSDQYSLSVVLYEVATGRPPFVVQSATDAIFKHVSEAPPPPRRFQPTLPAELEAIILRCLSKDRAARYASMHDVVQALRAVQTHLSPADSATIDASASVAALVLTPATARGRARGAYDVRVSNPSEDVAAVSLMAQDELGRLRYDLTPEALHLAPGETTTVRLAVAAPQRLLGTTQRLSFEVAATSESGDSRATTGTFVQTPLIPLWASAVLGVVLVVVGLLAWQATNRDHTPTPSTQAGGGATSTAQAAGFPSGAASSVPATNGQPTPSPEIPGKATTAGEPATGEATAADQLTFWSDRAPDGITRVYLLEVSDANLDSAPDATVVTPFTERSEYPAWSPDGTKLAFVVLRGQGETETAEIWVLDPSASPPTPRRLSVPGARDYNPAWSPDGTQIAFHSPRDSNMEIYVMDADGTNPRNLSRQPTRSDDPAQPASDTSPTWSPDGRQIAFASDRDGKYQLYVMYADGSGVRRLTENPEGIDDMPAWSPDGSQIAFKRQSGRDWDICALWTDGRSEPRNITRSAGDDSKPAWSPDGRWLAFESDRDTNPDGSKNLEIYIVEVDTTSPAINVTQDPHEDHWPTWRAAPNRSP